MVGGGVKLMERGFSSPCVASHKLLFRQFPVPQTGQNQKKLHETQALVVMKQQRQAAT